MYRPSAVVTIVDPEQHKTQSTADRWRALFGLTRTEALLTDALLAPDTDVADAADALGMARAAARVHLRNIFRTVGVHRQTDLVRLLMRLG